MLHYFSRRIFRSVTFLFSTFSIFMNEGGGVHDQAIAVCENNKGFYFSSD